MPDLTFAVKAHSESPARTRVSVRNFTLVVDEPPELGGTDAGPNPVETVLAAFAGCLNVVAHLVAKEQGLTLRDLELEASGALNPDRLMNQPTSDRAGFKQIAVTLRFHTDASPEAVERWRREVEARCPVSDNLSHITPVKLIAEHKT